MIRNISFGIEFLNKIRNESKMQTIRRETSINKDDRLNPFYKLRGVEIEHKPYDIHGNRIHRIIPDGIYLECVGVYPIELGKNFYQINNCENNKILEDRFDGILYEYSNYYLSGLNRFAERDGFESWEEMKEFFGLDKKDFSGKLILWEFSRKVLLEPLLQKCPRCGETKLIEKFSIWAEYYLKVKKNLWPVCDKCDALNWNGEKNEQKTNRNIKKITTINS